MGETGEWDQYSKWQVLAYLDREKAEEYAAKANIRAKEIHSLIMFAVEEELDIPDLENEYDPHMYMDYDGTSYFIVEVPLQTD